MTLQLIWQFFKQQLELLRQLTYPETVVVALFTISTLYIGPNKVFLIALSLLLFVLYVQTKNFYSTVWLTFLSTLLSTSGRHFFQVVLHGNEWSGGYDLFFTNSLLFNDFLLILLIYYIVTRKKLIEKVKRTLTINTSVIITLAIFLFTIFLSTFQSTFPSVSMYFFLQIVKMMLMFFVSVVSFSDEKLRNRSLQILLLLVFFNSVLIVAQRFNGGPLGFVLEDHSSSYGWYADENPELYRPGGMFSDPNLAATLISCALPFLIIKLFSNKNVSYRPLILAILVVLILALIFTASRAAWIVTFISYLMILKNYYSLDEIKAFIRKYFLFIAIPFLLLSPMIINRVATLYAAFGELGGGTFRLDHIRVGFHYMLREPFGTGPGTFMYRMALDFPPRDSGLMPMIPHNILAELGSEFGIVGLITFVGFCMILVKKQLQHWKKNHSENSLAMLTIFAVFVVLCQFFPWFINPRTASWFWIISAFVVSSSGMTILKNKQ